MPDIKTKEHIKNIKLLDKSEVIGERMRQTLVKSKKRAQDLNDNNQNSATEYAESNIQHTAEDLVDDFRNEVNASAERTMDLLKEKRYTKQMKSGIRNPNSHSNNLRSFNTTNNGPKVRSRSSIKTHSPYTVKTSGNSVKASHKGIKTAKHTQKTTVKTAEATAKAAQKSAKAAEKAVRVTAQAAKETARAIAIAAKAVGKAVVAAAKAIAEGVEALVAAIAAGGWIAVLVIVIVAVIGVLVGCSFGIFFSSEGTGERSMNVVVQEINTEYEEKIEAIKLSEEHDILEMTGSKAVWPEVLSVYAVKMTTDEEDPQEVASLSEEKENILRDIFWEMNEISHRTVTEDVKVLIESDDGQGNILQEEMVEERTTLHIDVSHKTAEDMMEKYRFSNEQKEQVQILLEEGNAPLWMSVLYGVFDEDEQIVAVALSQVGNVGGRPYWSWYGFGARVEWCACFVSWCANECGYIENGVIPKFSSCGDGIDWFKARAQWADNQVEPVPGMLIFFDWDDPNGPAGPQDGIANHVGIVERVENGRVYTVEGNSNDRCRQNSYPVGWYEIYGYGTPAY